MFERYTERARRVIFFARYEASEFGSPCIEAEHLLLAFLREDKYFSRQLLPNTSAESLRNEVEARTTRGPKVGTSVDMPLSSESQRVLAYAAEEAELLQDKCIDCQHLLLGLLREQRALAAGLLASHGVTLAAARACAAEVREKVREQAADLVQVHNRMLSRSSLQTKIRELSRFAWRQRPWKPLDILVEKDTGRFFFDLTLRNDPQFCLLAAGRAQGHCEICSWELNADNGPEHATGYTNGRDWVCEDCYSKFLSGPPPASPAESE